jgi:alkyl sulfatase BDS1-like metallo-beta-lactamase superfamily hydrolase
MRSSRRRRRGSSAGDGEHAVSENVYAGTAMGRRSAYMFGAALPKGPAGQLTAGLGPTTSTGTVTLIPQPSLSSAPRRARRSTGSGWCSR